MAITFLEKRKKLQQLIMILAVVILITSFVLWQGFVKKEPSIIEEPFIRQPKKVEINFKILKDPIFEELESFEEIPSFEEEIGREDPFIPY